MSHIVDWSTARCQRGMASDLESLREAFAEFASEFSGTSLSAKLRELLILDTAWRAESECLWSVHLETAMAVGITDLQMAAIQQGQIEAYVFSPKKKSILRFVSCAKASMTLSNEDVNDLKAHCDEREIADILAVDSALSHDRDCSTCVLDVSSVTSCLLISAISGRCASDYKLRTPLTKPISLNDVN